MDYLNLNNRELALLILYSSQGCATIDPDLAREVAIRLDPDIKKESERNRDARYRAMLAGGGNTKIQAIKKFREETGCPLKDAKEYIDRLLESTEGRTAKIIEGPIPKHVKCRDCEATIAYLPEEVEERHGTDYSGGPDGFRRVKCPRPGCPGYGYIESW